MDVPVKTKKKNRLDKRNSLERLVYTCLGFLFESCDYREKDNTREIEFQKKSISNDNYSLYYVQTEYNCIKSRCARLLSFCSSFHDIGLNKNSLSDGMGASASLGGSVAAD